MTATVATQPVTSIVVEEQKPDANQQQQRDKLLFKKLEETMLALKKDPSLYVEQVKRYTSMFQEEFKKVSEATQKKNERFGELAIFLCRCSAYYAADMRFIADWLMEMLTNYANILHPYNRRKAVSGIIILRSKNVLFPVATLQFLIGMLGVEDKVLRKTIYTFVLNDLQRINRHRRNNLINRQLQSWIHEYIRKNSDRVARKMVSLCIALYKKNIWSDVKVVNIIGAGCFSQSYKIRLISAHFLISTTEPQEEESSDEEDDGPTDPGQIKFRKGITKNTKNKEKQVEREKRRAQRKLKRKMKNDSGTRFFPIDQIHDPQDFSEKLYSVASKKDEKFIVRMVAVQLLARMINRHKLQLLPFYSMLQKYMHPGQKDVGKVLACFAESVHSYVPETELQPIIKHIVEHFVNDRCTELAMTMGLNVLREVFIKNPLLFDQDMLNYLCGYYEYKNRNVSSAAKSLINAVRDSHPEMLEKKFRGRTQKENQVKQDVLCDRIDGAELLGEDGNVPVFYDRILSDEDFRRIRLLKKKKEILEARKAMMGDEESEEAEEEAEPGEGSDEDQEVEEEEDAQNESDDNNDSEEQAEDEEEGDEELDWDNAEEIQGEEESEEEVEDSEEEEEHEHAEADQKKEKARSNQLKKESRKRKQQLDEIDSDEIELSQEEDENPHGFISENRITFYKKSKGEAKAEKRQQQEDDDRKKYVHKPKEKGGGTTDKEKLKNKPLMMLRPKKNKLRLRQKQVKSRIKDLKNRLGKAKTGKQGKEMKSKKLKKR